MPAFILSLIDAVAHWPERGALVGLDLGTKTIGVAVSDADRRLATGVETIQRTAFKADAARVLAIAAERNAVGFVLGLPINMDGSEGPRAQSTRAFARNFSKLTDLAIGLWDERLSTVAVERELIGMDMSRARRAEVIDEHAALFILQGALDRLAKLRAGRDSSAVTKALDAMKRAASGESENVLYPMREALAAKATVGEVSHALRDVWGTYIPADTF